MTNRIMVAAVFLVGCAVGGVSSQLVVPKASAQQAATLTKWEVHCFRYADADGWDDALQKMKAFGSQGWEPTGGENVYCFKRPKM